MVIKTSQSGQKEQIRKITAFFDWNYWCLYLLQVKNETCTKFFKGKSDE